ncbi:hypothetical protein GCM10025771_40380 [Niveibacterium umoris]|uniref:Calcineurin-like phosphoesterase domain-containing protein n=1 Tax=Niveibacterium umoris TaxID=1193620 RepID=A0A840BGK5_9RHOO|nr:metallophosphoesterase [Niveibacterium umoris]MBB4010759.1 hypothetical protein [Niveibacterium umoris]
MMRVLAVLLAVLISPAANAERYSFAAFGDLPYNEAERAEFPLLLDAMREAAVVFGVHVGDIKTGGTPCDDITLTDIRDLLAGAPFPTVYVPGDNEWVDCTRRSAGGFDALERLDKLRSLFQPKAESLGAEPFKVERQSDVDFSHGAYQEHLRWRRGPVAFLTLNVPGSDNNFGSGREASNEYRQRMSAVRSWLGDGFAKARRDSARAIVIFMHADPDFEAFAAGSPARAYSELLYALRSEVMEFEGEVVVFHGDTHVMRIDRPLVDSDGAPIERFRRAEVFGSPIPGWLEVTVDTEAEQLIRIRPRPLRKED